MLCYFESIRLGVNNPPRACEIDGQHNEHTHHNVYDARIELLHTPVMSRHRPVPIKQMLKLLKTVLEHHKASEVDTSGAVGTVSAHTESHTL